MGKVITLTKHKYRVISTLCMTLLYEPSFNSFVRYSRDSRACCVIIVQCSMPLDITNRTDRQKSLNKKKYP